jgi:hypothetical protein
MPKRIFDDTDDAPVSTLKINKQYAKKFEERKQREELSNCRFIFDHMSTHTLSLDLSLK